VDEEFVRDAVKRHFEISNNLISEEQMFTKKLFKLSALLVVLLVTFGALSFAQTTYYVNNDIGLDGYNGLSPTVGAVPTGPKRTIANAVSAAVNGDIIIIAQTGSNYTDDLSTGSKTLTFNSSNGTPVVANITIGAATIFTGPIAVAGTLTLTDAVTGANNITINDGGNIIRGAGSVDVAPVFAGKAALTYTATKTIGPELPTAAAVMTNLTVSGAITVTVNRSIQMNGILAVNNASGILALAGNTLTITNTTATVNHDITGTVTATSGGGIVASTTTGTVTFINGGKLPGLTTSATTGAVVVGGPVSMTGSVIDNAGALTLTTPTGTSGITGSLTNNGSGTVTVSATLTIGGNVSNTSTGVITFAAVAIIVNGNVTNSGALSNTDNATQIANAANISFGNAAIIIGGTVTNSVSFAGTTSGIAANAGGFLTSGNIAFASTTSAVTITGLVTNSSTSTFTLTGSAPNASILSGNGSITFANTDHDVTFTGGLINSSSGFSFAGTLGNGSVRFSGRTSGAIAVGAGANVTNNSSNTGAANGNIDFTAAATGAVTVGGAMSLNNSAGTGLIILGTGNATITGTVSNARTASAAEIDFHNTATDVIVGGLSQTGAGKIVFTTTTGGITITTGGVITVSAGTISTLTTSGAITVNGNYSQTGGTFSAAALTTGGFSVTGSFSVSGGTCDLTASGASNVSIAGDFSFTAGTIALGGGTRNFTLIGANAAMSTGVTFTGGGNSTLVFNRGISAQTLTMGIDVKWPGNLNLNNTFPAAPTFNLVSGNLIVGGNALFSAGGAVGGVNLNDNTLVVKGTTFTNNSGYTGTANGFVSMQGISGAQTINGSANFFNIEVDNAAGAIFSDGTGAAVTFTVTGTFNLANGIVGVGAGPDVIALNNATTPPTIVRNAGSFAIGAATYVSTINVVYIGGSKTMTNEMPVSGTNKLVNLTIATTGPSTVTVAAPFEFSGTLTVNSGQTLALATFIATSNGSSIVTNGSWTSTTGKIVLNKAGGTALTGAGALPQIDVANGSMKNSITGTVGITVGTTPNLSLVGATGNITLTLTAPTGTNPNIAGNLVTAAGSADTVTLGSNVIVAGVLTEAGGSIALGANNLTVQGAGSSIDGAATITGTGALVFNVTGNSNLTITTSDATIAANVTLNLGASGNLLSLQANNLTIAGTLTLTKGTFDLVKNLTLTGNALGLTANGSIANTGVLTFAPTTGTLTATLAGATTFNNLTINGAVTLAGTSGALTITTTLTHTAGLLTFADRDIITSTFTRTGGTYSATTGFLQVNTALTQGTGFSIPNLRINGTFTVGSAQNFSVTGTLHLLSGTLTHTVATVARLNIPVGGTVQVTAGLLDVAPVYAGGFNLTYTNTGAITTGKEWPTTGNVKTLTIGGSNTVTLATGSYTDSTGLVLTSGTFAIPTATTLTLANGVAISKTGNATVTFAGTGAIVYAGSVDVTYTGTVADATGPELPTNATALRNLTFTRTGNVVNFTTTNAQSITVNGTLTIGNDLSSSGTITALGNVTVAADAVPNASSPSITGAALTFSGTIDQTFTVPAGTTNIGSITINKLPASLLVRASSVIISGGDLKCTGTVTFISGLVKTGATNALVLTNGAGVSPVNVGFVRNVAAGGRSHVVGNVRQDLAYSTSIVYARNEFPVGDTLNYRPVALTFVSTSGNSRFGVVATVSHTNSRPTGTAGLPITNGIADGIDLAKYPSFFWSISTDHDMGNTAFNLDLTAAGFNPAQIDIADLGLNHVKIIRRSGISTDTLNQWNLQGARDSYDNVISAGVPTVIAIGATSGLSQSGAIFTYGTKATLVVLNAIPNQTLTAVAPIFKQKLASVFGGNTGTLTYSAVSGNNVIVSAAIVGNDTLKVVNLRPSSTPITITVTATDIDNSRISTTFTVTTSGVNVDDKANIIPTEFSLSQNYPNPFNPSTTISFGLPRSSNVTLKVYNILGEEVANLVNKVMPAGYQTVVFDASKLASGMYIYRLEAGSFVQVKKMMMLK
jgi:hypothetical protein